MCVSACAVAFLSVGNSSGQTPQPYARPRSPGLAAFGFLALLLFFATFFGASSFLAFVAFAGLSAFGFSVPSIDQNRQPLQATPSIAALPADDGLL